MGIFVSQFVVFNYHPWGISARILVPCVASTQNTAHHTAVQLVDTSLVDGGGTVLR